MTPSGQSQRAGQGATQIQVTGDYVVHQGIDEERAREISVATSQAVVAEYSREALVVVHERLENFQERVLKLLGERQQLDAFGDPSFLRTYKKAQEGAASTEREDDYDMLAALLNERAENPSDRRRRAAIERAVEVVDQIDEPALRALTVVYSMSAWVPASMPSDLTIGQFDVFFGALSDGGLPSGEEWLDHLDILDAMRIDMVNGFRKFDDYYPDQFRGWLAPGIETHLVPEYMSEPVPDIPWAFIVDEHEFKPGFSRVRTGTERSLRTSLSSQLTPIQVDAVIEQSKALFGLGEIDATAKTTLARRFREKPNLGRVAEWWDAIPRGAQTTVVGETIARANALRLDAAGILPGNRGVDPLIKFVPVDQGSDPGGAAPDTPSVPSDAAPGLRVDGDTEHSG